MKKIEMSKKITIEFTEKELISILTYLDDFFEWLEQSRKLVSFTENLLQKIENKR